MAQDRCNAGKVVSINVGQPREMQWRGKVYVTAINKQPIAGRVRVHRLNIEGDAQADLVAHGGEQRAVFVYQGESYRYWASLLGRSDLSPGIFGENLTVEGLADAQVCIGDRYRIGSALFEVTQPRVTCFKVGIQLGRPDMPALLVAHRRPGFYFRVIEEGDIAANDVIEKVAQGPERMSVVDMDALLYTANHPVPTLKRALKISALSPGWQSSMHSLLDAAEHGNTAGNVGLATALRAPLAWHGLRQLAVSSVSTTTEDVKVFELSATDGMALPPYLPGQYLTLRLPGPADTPAVLRNYSLCGPPTRGTYRIGVKLESQGVGSTFLHHHVRVGDLLDAAAPRGDFTLSMHSNSIALISAGIGVTPVLAMLCSLVASGERSARKIWWIHQARNLAHHAFATDVAKLIAGRPNIVRVTLYSRPGQAESFGTDYDFAGRLDLALLLKLNLPIDTDYYLCGPAAFLSATQEMLRAHGVASAQVHKEIFGPAPSSGDGLKPAPHAPAGVPGRGPMVSFIRSGLSVPWREDCQSLLELAEACDVPVRWSCRTGVCHNCESGLVEGKLIYRVEPIDSPPAGAALICCAVPASDIALDL